MQPSTSNKLYGVTHDTNGTPRIVEPKTIKVGIGLAKGKAIHTYINLDKKWVVVSGFGNQVTRETLDTKEKAQARYRELKKTAPDRKYPERLPYFTFSHIAGSGDFEPDWEAIESHGPIPTEIDIIFIHDDPWSAAYQMWTATELKCKGDGLEAQQVLAMAETAEEKTRAAQAQKNGEKYFSIECCASPAGCKYAKSTNDKPAPCRPMGRLAFQLLKSPRLGGTATFNTAGFRSISQIFSSLEIFKQTTGRGNPEKGFVAGIPIKMVLRPYRTTFNGKATTQYAVGLEFRAESALALKRDLIEQAVQFRIADREPLKQLEGAVVQELTIPAQEPEEIAAIIAAEFEPTPPDPTDDAELGPSGALENAWEEPETNQALPKDDPRVKFYEYCRAKGMTDQNIADHLGSIGCETCMEIQPKDIPELMAWATAWTPAPQGSLL